MKPSSPIRDTFHIPFSVIRTLQFCLGNQDKYWDENIDAVCIHMLPEAGKIEMVTPSFHKYTLVKLRHFNFIYIKFKIKCVTTYLHKNQVDNIFTYFLIKFILFYT